MSMYFCHYTFEANGCPKYMREAMQILTGAQGTVFLQSSDVEILASRVKDALMESKPKCSTAHVTKHVPDTGSIQIDIYKDDHSDTSIGRAYFAPVRSFTTYDLDEKRLIEVKLKMEEPYNE